MKIDNKVLSAIFDRFDFPIRLIYSQTGPISKLLNRAMFWRLYSSDFDKLDDRFREMFSFMEQNGVDVRDRVVLELGPGNSYINAYNFLLKGAKKVILVDKFPRVFNTAEQQAFFRRELDYIQKINPDRELFFVDKDFRILPEFIEFIPHELTDLESLSVDFIYSVSVMEHVKRVKENLAKMVDILRPGGYMYHHIDMRDHYNFSNPFLFYKYSDKIWERWLTKEGLTYTNRWRYTDFMDEFQKLRLQVVREQPKKYPLERIHFDERFKYLSDLEIGILDIILRK